MKSGMESGQSFTLLDGALGTELIRRGYREHPLLWTAPAVFSHSRELIALHREYLEAGADIITANTFRSGLHSFFRAGISQPEKASADHIRKAMDCAHSAREAFHGGKIALSIAPSADCYLPGDYPGDAAAAENFEHLLKIGIDCAPDLILLETHNSLNELTLALKLAQHYARQPILISVMATASGTLINGDDLNDFLALAEQDSVSGLLLNCSAVSVINHLVPAFQHLKRPFGFYANLDHHDGNHEAWSHATELPESLYSPHEYRLAAQSWQEQGASLLGACCGSSPEHIYELNRLRQ